VAKNKEFFSMLAQDIITVQMTPEQHNLFIAAMNEAKARDYRISDWTGETAAEIEARYQLPHDDILNDIADAFFAQKSGVLMF
jgi:hypothetical protein